MEKFALKKKQFVGFCLLILFSILINYGGSLFASTNKLPVWLDSAGTVLAAYLGGPVCGALVGLTANLTKFLVFGNSWSYCVVSIAIGIVVGLAAKREGFASLLGIMNTAAMTAVTATVISTALILMSGKNSTGNIWGDAIIGAMMERGVSIYMSLPVGQLYVEVLDKLATLFVLYILLKLNYKIAGFKFKRMGLNQPEKEEDIEILLQHGR